MVKNTATKKVSYRDQYVLGLPGRHRVYVIYQDGKLAAAWCLQGYLKIEVRKWRGMWYQKAQKGTVEQSSAGIAS